MSLKRFFAYSFAVHSLIIVAVTLLTPAIKEKKLGEEFLTTLVSPDEVPTRLPFIPAKPRSHYVPHARQKTSAPAPPPAIKDNGEVTPEKGISSSLRLPKRGLLLRGFRHLGLIRNLRLKAVGRVKVAHRNRKSRVSLPEKNSLTKISLVILQKERQKKRRGKEKRARLHSTQVSTDSGRTMKD